MIKSRIASKARTTIPQQVMAALHLHEGDQIEYRIETELVIIAKHEPKTVSIDPFATFAEWHSEADQRAYGQI